MRPGGRVPLVAGLLAALGLLALVLLLPFDIRHSAPFGVSSTFDRQRLIAVRGGYVTPNYPGFSRIDLDLRAYSPATTYDLTVHIRLAGPAAPDLRTLPLQVTSAQIWNRKQSFGNPFITLRFPPIADSAGQRYYVWVEAGPRNRDDVWTLWAIKSYSHLTGRAVLAALVASPPAGINGAVGQVAMVLLLLGTVVGFGWLVAALAAHLARSQAPPAVARGGG